MAEYYLPTIALEGANLANIKFNIEYTKNIPWHIANDDLNVSIQYIYYISYVEIEVSLNGIDLESLIRQIRWDGLILLNSNITDHINENNSYIHVINKGWNFFYPREYEENIKPIFPKLLTMDEYWIKNIIE